MSPHPNRKPKPKKPPPLPVLLDAQTLLWLAGKNRLRKPKVILHACTGVAPSETEPPFNWCQPCDARAVINGWVHAYESITRRWADGQRRWSTTISRKIRTPTCPACAVLFDEALAASPRQRDPSVPRLTREEKKKWDGVFRRVRKYGTDEPSEE